MNIPGWDHPKHPRAKSPAHLLQTSQAGWAGVGTALPTTLGLSPGPGGQPHPSPSTPTDFSSPCLGVGLKMLLTPAWIRFAFLPLTLREEACSLLASSLNHRCFL